MPRILGQGLRMVFRMIFEPLKLKAMLNDKRLIDLTVSDLEPIIYSMMKKALNNKDPVTAIIDGDTFIDINEASLFIKLSKPSIYRLVGNRNIPFYRSGRKLLFKVEELIEWIEKSRKKFNHLKL